MNNIFLIIYFLVYLWCILFWGELGLKALRLSFESKVEKKIFEFAVGNFLFSLVFHYLGIFHLLYKELILIIYLLPLIFLVKKVMKSKYDLNLIRMINKLLSYRWETAELLILISLILIFGQLIPHLFIFPSSWDPLAYHLMLPKQYLSNHFFAFYRWFPQTVMPVGIESLFSFGELFSEPRLANLITFSFLAAMVIYIVYGLRYLFPRGLLVLMMGLFLFRQILFSQVSINPFIDFPLAFYGLVIGLIFYKYTKTLSWKYLLLLLIFGIFTFLIKYIMGLVLIFSLTLVLVAHSLLNINKFKTIINDMKVSQKLFFVATLILVLFPLLFWLNRNYSLTHNPTYPFLNPVWNNFVPVLDYNEEHYKATVTDIRSGSLNRGIAKSIISGTPVKFPYEELLFSTTLLGFSILGFFNNNKGVRYLSVLTFVTASIIHAWSGFPSYRYSLVIAPILALIGAFVIADLLKYPLRWKSFPLLILILLSITIQFFLTSKQGYKFFTAGFDPSIRGLTSYDGALKNLFSQDNYKNINYVNRHLNPNQDKIMVFFDNRLYYFEVPVEYVNPSISIFFNPYPNRTVLEIYEELKSQGFTYVFVNNNWGYGGSLNKNLFESFVSTHLQPISTISGTIVYRIK